MSEIKQLIPNDRELELRDEMKKTQLVFDIDNVTEFVRVRRFTDEEVPELSALKEAEHDSFTEKCKKESLMGIFYAQFNKNTILDKSQLKALDHVQDTEDTDKFVIYQEQGNNSLEAFVKRVNECVQHHPKKEHIILLNPEVSSLSQQELLRNKTQWIIEQGFKKVGIIYYDNKNATTGIEIIVPALKAANVELYFFQVPITKKGTAHVLRAFVLGASKTCHRRSPPIPVSFPPKFIEPDWSFKELNESSEGLVKYEGATRKEFLRQDGRKSYVYNFSRWDLIMQVNYLCKEQIGTKDITKIKLLKETISKLL
jgi:hypothetical protein